MGKKRLPEIPGCCDMRGMLSFQILWLLSKGPMHGQEIANEIARRRGSKPTPGTIYPALKDLRERRLIEGRRQGRKVVYSLTRGTKREVEKACRYFCGAFLDIFEEYRDSSTMPEHRSTHRKKRTSRAI